MIDMIDRNFGSWRGAVRLGLSYAEVLGGMAEIQSPVPGAVRRLVFVCHGNICRSAFADALARRAGYNVASFGLSTSADKPAYPAVVDFARGRGLDLTAHLTTRAEDFVAEDGDYLLGMEVRHLRKLAANERLRDLPRGLLGRYGAFSTPHLHDPYELGAPYMATCLTRIEAAVSRLCAAYPAARFS